MEDRPVVESLAHERLDPRDVVGRRIGPHLNHDCSAGGQLQHQLVRRVRNHFSWRVHRQSGRRRRRGFRCNERDGEKWERKHLHRGNLSGLAEPSCDVRNDGRGDELVYRAAIAGNLLNQP